jgi:hypothetical protein
VAPERILTRLKGHVLQHRDWTREMPPRLLWLWDDQPGYPPPRIRHRREFTVTTNHIAAPARMCGLYQDCRRCGYVFQDLTRGEALALEDQADVDIPSWPEGRRIAVDGNASWQLRDGAPLVAGEIECRPTS